MGVDPRWCDAARVRERALSRILSSPWTQAGAPFDLVAGLGRLCRAVTTELDLVGGCVTLVPEIGSHSVAAASSPLAERLEQLQFGAGEGPTREAYDTGYPVILGDLVSAPGRWPGYVATALTLGVGAVASFPLLLGASRFGSLSLYWADPGRPLPGQVRVALVYAEIATELLIDSSLAGPGGLDPGLRSALATDGAVYQAQGMVMVDLGVSLVEALARMRAHAFATSTDLSVLAARIVSGETSLHRDP